MCLRIWACAVCLSFFFQTSVFASEASDPERSTPELFNLEYSDPALSNPAETQDSAFELNISGTKILTNDFSFQLPDHWANFCTVSAEDGDCEIYVKNDSSEEESELLFSIESCEETDWEELADSAILGFRGSRTYLLIPHYRDLEEEPSGALRRFCKKAEKLIKKSFVSYITES